MSALPYEVVIDDLFANVTTDKQLKKAVNNRILSMLNDFEDGAWRHGEFHKYLWDNIALTALSARERSALVNQSHSTLVAAAQNLRLTDKDEKGQGSEIAEVFLYEIMHHHFNALPVVPKIFYKQNSQGNAKGADSVHIVLNGDDFTLWFGEAKFYNSIADARLEAVVGSVIASLATDKLKKENAIITNVSELDCLDLPQSLRDKIKAALKSTQSIDHIKSKIHVPILLLHECETTAETKGMSSEYKTKMIEDP